MRTLLVYTKQGCNGCLEAKNFLDDLNIPYTEVDVEFNQHSADFLIQQGDKFLPQFYSNGKKFIPGGWKSLKTMRQSEILDRLK
jgi:glutaredoxin